MVVTIHGLDWMREKWKEKTTNVFDTENPAYLRKLYIKRFLHYQLTKEENRILNFHRFNKNYIHRSKWMIDGKVPKNLHEKYEYFIAGSDQVWNPYLEYCTEANFLTFATHHQKVALSPSIAIDEIPEEKKESFSKWIQDFRLLSVREEKGKELICQLCGREAQVLCDPTMYLSALEWQKIEEKPKKCPKKYILTYFLGNCDEAYAMWIRELADAYHLEILELQNETNFGIAPDEFLYLIHHAACVCTDSFHGTVFSLIFHTPFVVFERKEHFKTMKSRLDTLLSMMNCLQRKQNNMDMKRYIKFFTLALKTVMSAQQYEGKTVLCWQQFYGIAIAFFCRLFHMKKKYQLVIMTFIYKQKKGLAGRLFYHFVKYAITSPYVDKIILTTQSERKKYQEIFGVDEAMFGFAKCGAIEYQPEEFDDNELKKKNYLFSTGRSNRDYSFLMQAIEGTEYQLIIACDWNVLQTKDLPESICDRAENDSDSVSPFCLSLCR